jgi:hypothetical protein
MRIRILLFLAFYAFAARAETVRLNSVASIWLSDDPHEVNTSGGKCDRFKLKSIQEFACIRFDAAPLKGKSVTSARLFLLPCDADHKLRYLRVSTVNQNWEEGSSSKSYGPASGATYLMADSDSKRAWTFPGSEISDAIMTAGQTLATWGELKREKDGWVSVAVTTELIYALACGDTDGLAVMDGGTIKLHNNFVNSSHAKGREPYLEVELGANADAVPASPDVKAEPAPKHASLTRGSIKLAFAPAKDALCWKITLNGKPVDRWRVYHPKKEGPTEFHLDDLDPDSQCELEITAYGPGGKASPAKKVSVKASPALSAPPDLGKLDPPASAGDPPTVAGKMRVFACPDAIKISPEKPEVVAKDEVADVTKSNGVWNGKEVHLQGCRAEYVSFQLCIESLGEAPLNGVKVTPKEFKGPGDATIGGKDVELSKLWYALNRDQVWQPAYCLPMEAGAAFAIPDPKEMRKVSVEAKHRKQKEMVDQEFVKQENQSILVDLYIPKDAKPGDYAGTIAVEAEGVDALSIPVQLKVYDLLMPDKLCFWPELNAYNNPKNQIEYYKLAHQNRCVLNINTAGWAPQLQGAGKDIKVVWDKFDENAGKLISGEAFKTNRRSGVPLECMYLPNYDSWPTPLSEQNYNYHGHWPGRGEDTKFIDEQELKAPYIGDALNQDYKDAFLAVERQYIEHFKEKGWNQTEMQCFYGGKNTHRTDYGSNMWWTTDEPYAWEDWLALQFFCKLWTQGREAAKGDPRVWSTRGDISRPNWEGRVMEGVLDKQYGAMSGVGVQRLKRIHEDSGIRVNNYGGASPDNASNLGSLTILLNVWLSGGDAHLPWQTIGGDKCLDVIDGGTSGNALLVAGDRLGVPVLADMRLKVLRDAEQFIELCKIICDKRGLNRDQIAAMIQKAMPFTAGRVSGANADNADAVAFSSIQAWQFAELRKRMLALAAGQ